MPTICRQFVDCHEPFFESQHMADLSICIQFVDLSSICRQSVANLWILRFRRLPTICLQFAEGNPGKIAVRRVNPNIALEILRNPRESYEILIMSRISNTEYRIPNTEYRIPNTECGLLRFLPIPSKS